MNQERLNKPGNRYHGMTRGEAHSEALRILHKIGRFTQQWYWSDARGKFVETAEYARADAEAWAEVGRIFETQERFSGCK